MVRIEIDGIEVEVPQGSMVIEAADALNVSIPRFCYHKKLSIAANCRMCLIEVEKAPKPLPACATPVTDGMKVWTSSPRARAAQQSVMEFLLINHPLDCPICDQGGECELQDVSLGYGKDASRFEEGKRVVKDKDIGPLIATEMTRCIHCTRCVRFGEEVAGLREMGATGRGESTEIGTYIEDSVDSEVSGNIIDLCPVGALTSKPYAYAARGWELERKPSVSPHDCVGSNLYLHVRRNEVMRVVPAENETVNEVWLSDRDRFSYEALLSPERLEQPLVRKEGQWQTTSWLEALEFAVKSLKDIKSKHGGNQIAGLISPSATLEESYLFQKFVRALGSNHIDHRLRQQDFRDQDMAPLYPHFGLRLADIELKETVLLVGSNIHKEQPIVGLRLRKMVTHGGKVAVVNPADFSFNFDIAHKDIAEGGDMVPLLAGIAKAAMERTNRKGPTGADKLLTKVVVSDTHRAIADDLLTVEKRLIMLGQLALMHPEASRLVALANLIATVVNGKVGVLSDGANAAGAWITGCVPHRAPGGKHIEDGGKTALDVLNNPLKAYVLLGIEPELDSLLGSAVNKTFDKAEFVVALAAYDNDTLRENANVILPVTPFSETSGTFVNGNGDWQSFQGAVKPVGESRPAWKALRVLGNLASFSGFEHTSSRDILQEVKEQVGDSLPLSSWEWWCPTTLETNKSKALLELRRFHFMPLML